ncbi:MAG: hypothetical protein WDO24_27375 [Pseudomonadota bacterium]
MAGGLWLTALAHPAAAQGVVNPEYRALYDTTFSATYANPADVPAALNFAKAATLAGDLEGAIGALERVLIFNPDLPEVYFELGRLYRALGAFDTARLYFERADPARLSPEDRALRDRNLAEIDSALARHKFSGALATGLRYQTNANAGATEAARLALGPPGMPPPPSGTANSFRGRPDADAFGAATVQHSYDLGDQAGDSWDSRLSLYGTRQFHRHLLNVSLAEIDTGPRFRLGSASDPTCGPMSWPICSSWAARPISSATAAASAAMRSSHPLDGRCRIRAAQSQILQLLARIDCHGQGCASGIGPRDRRLPADRQRSRHHAGAGAQLRRPAELRDLPGNPAVEQLHASLRHAVGRAWPAWSATLYGGPIARRYAGIDSSTDPNHRRQDGEWDLGAALTVGLTDKVDFRLELQQVWANSNVLLYQYRDTAVLGSIEFRF